MNLTDKEISEILLLSSMDTNIPVDIVRKIYGEEWHTILTVMEASGNGYSKLDNSKQIRLKNFGRFIITQNALRAIGSHIYIPKEGDIRRCKENGKYIQ